MGPLIPLFRTSCDISPRFYNQGSSPSLHTLSPACNGSLYSVLSARPADLLATRMVRRFLSPPITARKRSLRRLCFYRCLSVDEGGHVWQGARTWQGGMCGGGVCVAEGGAFMVGGMCGRGACVVGSVHGTHPPGRYYKIR